MVGYGCCYNTLPLSGPGHSDPGQRYELIPPPVCVGQSDPGSLSKVYVVTLLPLSGPGHSDPTLPPGGY